MKKELKYYNFDLTIGEFRMTFSDWTLDPEGQRDNVEQKLEAPASAIEPSKAQGIIKSILDGEPFGQIIATHNKEVRVGGHRTRSIKAYIENKFRDWDNGLYFRELDDDTQKMVLDTPMDIVMLKEGVEPNDVVRVCQNEGKATHINEAENLNFHIATYIARAVRYTVKYAPAFKHLNHPLYKSTQMSPDEAPVFEHLVDNNIRHRLELDLARIYYLVYKNEGLTAVVPYKDCQSMYEQIELQTDEKVVKKLKSKVDKILDTLFDFSQINKLKRYEFNWFYRFLIKKNFEWGSWEWKNDESFKGFYHAVKNELNACYDNTKKTGRLIEVSPFDVDKTVYQQIKSGLTEYKDTRVVNWTVDEILNGIDIFEYINLKDPTRLFTSQERETQWSKQFGKCFVTGKDVKITDAHAAHIIAHSNGGRTELENMVMVEASHNLKMGGMNLIEYLKYYKNEGNEISDMAEELIKTGKKA